MKRRWPKGTWMKFKPESPDVLRALMKSRGMSYADVGRGAGCHRSMISALVNGHRNSCTDELADRIALVLGIPTEVLFAPQVPTASGRNSNGKAA